MLDVIRRAVRTRWFLCAALTAGLWVASVAAAQAHPFWLTASDLRPRKGDPVQLGACSGVGFKGEARDFSRARCVDYSWVVNRPYTLAPLALDGEPDWGRITFEYASGQWVQYVSDFASIELPAREFDAYLAQQGLYGPLQMRRRLPEPTLGRERYRRCAKLWLAGHDVFTARRAIGQPLEIVPLQPPGDEPALRVRVLWQGKPLVGAILQTWRQPLADDGRPRPVGERDSVAVEQKLRTDARGEAVIDVRAAGEWLVSVVHMVPCREPEVADWESTWASLVFARPLQH